MQASASEPQPAAVSTRLFLALCPGEADKAALAAHAQSWQWNADATRYAPADWHVTLHFIGSLPRPRMDALRAELAVPMTPFELRLGQPALWPRGLAVLLPIAVPEALRELHARLGHALRGLGLRADTRPYHPHITLARGAAQARPPARWPAFGWQVTGYALMESTGQARQRYRVLQHYGPALEQNPRIHFSGPDP